MWALFLVPHFGIYKLKETSHVLLYNAIRNNELVIVHKGGDFIMDKKKKNTRSRKYLLTINNPKEHGETHDVIIKKMQKYQLDIMVR